jgi:hypothetical protein
MECTLTDSRVLMTKAHKVLKGSVMVVLPQWECAAGAGRCGLPRVAILHSFWDIPAASLARRYCKQPWLGIECLSFARCRVPFLLLFFGGGGGWGQSCSWTEKSSGVFSFNVRTLFPGTRASWVWLFPCFAEDGAFLLWLAAGLEAELVMHLADYVLDHHYSHLKGHTLCPLILSMDHGLLGQ